MFNLFALTDDPMNRVVRFSLSSDVQSDLTRRFKDQEQEFTTNGEEEIPFDGNYKPDSGEVLVISNFDDIDGVTDAISSPLAVQEIMPTPGMFDKIKALFSGYEENGVITVLIQMFDRRHIISTNGLSIFHSRNTYKKIEGVGLTVDSKLTAILKGSDLKFNSFHLLRRIFDVSSYYKEATDGDIEKFSSMACVVVNNPKVMMEISDNWVRRKLWLISQSQILDKVSIRDIKIVATEFNIKLNIQESNGEKKLVIPEEKRELKTLLRFLDEDYYKSPLLQNQYVANSKRPVE